MSEYEAWMLFVDDWGEDSHQMVVERVFTGPRALGEAQEYQRERGGLLVKALGWDLDTDEPPPNSAEAVTER